MMMTFMSTKTLYKFLLSFSHTISFLISRLFIIKSWFISTRKITCYIFIAILLSLIEIRHWFMTRWDACRWIRRNSLLCTASTIFDWNIIQHAPLMLAHVRWKYKIRMANLCVCAIKSRQNNKISQIHCSHWEREREFMKLSEEERANGMRCLARKKDTHTIRWRKKGKASKNDTCCVCISQPSQTDDELTMQTLRFIIYGVMECIKRFRCQCHLPGSDEMSV